MRKSLILILLLYASVIIFVLTTESNIAISTLITSDTIQSMEFLIKIMNLCQMMNVLTMKIKVANREWLESQSEFLRTILSRWWPWVFARRAVMNQRLILIDILCDCLYYRQRTLHYPIRTTYHTDVRKTFHGLMPLDHTILSHLISFFSPEVEFTIFIKTSLQRVH